MSSTVVGMFVCQTVNGQSYLVQDFTIHCGDARWLQYLPAGLVLLLVYPIG